jgi:hypothetical protein
VAGKESLLPRPETDVVVGPPRDTGAGRGAFGVAQQSVVVASDPFVAVHPARCTARHGVGSHAEATTMECAVPVG